jgi:hypothetical protein
VVFQDSISAPFTCRVLLTDIGLVQETAFQASLSHTLRRLNDFFPFPASQIAEIAATVNKLNGLRRLPDIHFVMPGAGTKMKVQDNCIVLPHRSNFYRMG